MKLDFKKELEFAQSAKIQVKNRDSGRYDTVTAVQNWPNFDFTKIAEQAVRVGLSLNPYEAHKLAYVMPAYGNQKEPVFIPSYLGLIKICATEGIFISASVVYENDKFSRISPDFSDKPVFEHQQGISKTGEVIGAYSVGLLKVGDKWVYCGRALNSLDLAKKSKAINSAKIAENGGENEMRMKTVVRNLLKYLLQYTESEALKEALTLSESANEPDIAESTLQDLFIIYKSASQHVRPDLADRIFEKIAKDVQFAPIKTIAELNKLMSECPTDLLKDVIFCDKLHNFCQISIDGYLEVADIQKEVSACTTRDQLTSLYYNKCSKSQQIALVSEFSKKSEEIKSLG